MTIYNYRRTYVDFVVLFSIAGVMTAIALKKRLGFHNFKVRTESHGGGSTTHCVNVDVRRSRRYRRNMACGFPLFLVSSRHTSLNSLLVQLNTYPVSLDLIDNAAVFYISYFRPDQGCACDIATHWYSYSEELNPDWDHSHVYQPVLKAYWKGIAEKYGIVRHVRFFSKVLGADWDIQRQMYRVEVLDVRNGDTHVEYANAVVSAVGFLNQPYFVENLKGVRDTFKGEHFHSARWDHSVDLRHKRVAVIGNSNSA